MSVYFINSIPGRLEMKRLLAATSIFISICGAASAQNECAALRDSAARLACYDTAYGGKEIESDETGPIGEWNVRTETSPMTDETTVVAALESQNEISDRFGLGAGSATMILRCHENTTSAYLTFNGRFMADIQGYGVIEYRLDKGAMRKLNTSESTDNMALGLWSGGKAIPFIKDLYPHDTLIVRATPFNESSLTLTFDIRGAEEATKKVRETCGW